MVENPVGLPALSTPRKILLLEEHMDIYTDTIRDLGPAEKLRLVEQIWDDLAAEGSPLPLPDWG